MHEPTCIFWANLTPVSLFPPGFHRARPHPRIADTPALAQLVGRCGTCARVRAIEPSEALEYAANKVRTAPS